MSQSSGPSSDSPVVHSTGAESDRSSAPAPKRKSRSRWPPLIVRFLIIVCLVAALYVRWSASSGDYATANILTVLCGFLAVTILSIWFVFFSGYALRSRLAASLFALLTIAALAGLFRLDHVSGELIPAFRPRWEKRPDEQLGRPPAAAAVAAEIKIVSSDSDFPQFLGKNRSGRVEGANLARNWNTNPPKQIWRHPIGAGWSAFAVMGNAAFTLEQRGAEEFVTCYEVDSGKLVWSYGTQGRHQTVPGGIGPRSTPTVDDQQVYTLGAFGEVLCLNAATGALIWRDNLLERFDITPDDDLTAISWGRAASPLIVDNLVVLPAGGSARGPWKSLIAYDKSTGNVVWEAGEDQVSYSSPTLTTLAGVRQILIVNEKTVTGHEPETGRVLWSMDWPGHTNADTNAAQAVPIAPDKVFVSKGYTRGSALVQLTGSPDSLTVQDVWRNTGLLKTKFTNVVVYEDHIYGLSDGVLECAELASGARRWKKGRYGQGQILGVDDLILVQAESGDVAMVEANPERFTELGSFSAIDGITWNNLCLAGKKLLVRNAEEAACYELP